MKILVVEDKPENIKAAESFLTGHEVTIVTGFDQAYELFHPDSGDPKEAPFEVVLTDVMLPKGGNRCMSYEGQELARRQGTMPYGPIIALHALQAGVKKIGIITSGDHHADPFVFAFDFLRGFTSGEINVFCTHYLTAKMELQTGTRLKQPEYNDREAYEAFRSREQNGEIVNVKDWTGLLRIVLQEPEKDASI